MIELVEMNLVPQVGRFFTDLTAHILGATQGESVHEHGPDLVSWELDAKIEVKGGDSCHPFRICRRQLENYLDQLKFPLYHTLYVLYCYENGHKNGKKTPKLLKASDGKRNGIRKFLAEHLSSVYILDAEAMNVIARAAGRTYSYPRKREYPMYGVWRGFLDELFGEGASVIPELKLDPAGFRMDRFGITTRFERHRLEIPANALVAPDTLDALITVLKTRKMFVQQRLLFPFVLL